MKKMTVVVLMLSTTFTLPIMAQDIAEADSCETRAVTVDASYTGDVAATVAGGNKQGVTYLGFLHAGVKLDLGKLGLLKGGSLYLAGANTHGGEPSAKFTGDMQGWNNIEA